MSEEPWDQILDMLDHLASTAATVPNPAVEATFARLISEAKTEGFVDPELHVDDTARWLTAMLAAHRAARDAHPEMSSDNDGAVLRLIVTRWLHPHRLDQREPRT